MYGNPETTPGGLALKFYSSVRLDIRRTESIKDGEKVIGNRVRVKVVKNKIAAPFQQAEFEMMFGQGIDAQGCVLDVGVSAGIIEKTGTWFLYKTERLGQGRDNAKAFLKANPAMSEEIEKAVRAKYLTPAEAAPDASPAESVEKPAKEAKEKEKAKAGK
jgi:recombination protein RecA